MFRVGFIIFVFLFCSSTAFSKTLTIIAAADRGVPFNSAKLMSSYIKQYDKTIDNVVIKVVPGAGGTVAANYLYNMADKDGYTIGTFPKDVILKGFVADKNNRYQTDKFTWLGSTTDGRLDPTVLAVNKLYDGNQLVVGGMNPKGSIMNFIPKAIGWNIKTVFGYRNKLAMKLALVKNEIDGYLLVLSGSKDNEHIKYGFQINKTRSPELKSVPTLRELLKDKSYLERVELVELAYTLARPYVAPPGIPEERKLALIKAIEQTMKNKEFVHLSNKMLTSISYVSADEANKIIKEISKKDKELIKQVLTSNRQ
jgi:tripartite-type tricarboxylate transporter receptor subunit TctC